MELNFGIRTRNDRDVSIAYRELYASETPSKLSARRRWWVNGADSEDFVALYPQLDRRTFGDGTIINISALDNGYEDAHSITQYLSHPEVVAEIVSALKLS